jgi:ribosomal protein S18 acetylase RimI-like enzyme
MTHPHTANIRTARPGDVLDIATLLAEAFLHGDLAPWLIGNPTTRARVYRPYFLLLAEQALDHGHIDLTSDATAAAVWYPIAGGPPPAARDYDSRLAEITGRYLPRFAALDAAMHRHHPYLTWHHYLAFLAVHPDHQRRGFGSALLTHHHNILDAHGTPAYLEATGDRNARLYARHGYRPRPAYRISGDGPTLIPMWRPPAGAPTDDNTSSSHALHLRPEHPPAPPTGARHA